MVGRRLEWGTLQVVFNLTAVSRVVHGTPSQTHLQQCHMTCHNTLPNTPATVPHVITTPSQTPETMSHHHNTLPNTPKQCHLPSQHPSKTPKTTPHATKTCFKLHLKQCDISQKASKHTWHKVTPSQTPSQTPNTAHVITPHPPFLNKHCHVL